MEKPRLRILFVVFLVLCALSQLALSGEPEVGLDTLMKEVQALKEGHDRLSRELQEIKNQLQPRPQHPPGRNMELTLSVADAPFRGERDAKLTMVEFTDYECTFCGRYANDTLPQVLQEYVDPGIVKYVIRDFPLTHHGQAAKAAEATHCAGDQGKYWEMHVKLFASQQALSLDDLIGYAEPLGLDARTFENCLNSGKHTARIEQGIADGREARVRGTPAFLLGYTADNGNGVETIRLIHGAQRYENFKRAIDLLLLRQGGEAQTLDRSNGR
jgi:protein-disulfide isomerase